MADKFRTGVLATALTGLLAVACISWVAAIRLGIEQIALSSPVQQPVDNGCDYDTSRAGDMGRPVNC